MENFYPHIPVCLEETLQFFTYCHLKTFVDGTLGAGGHALTILERHPEIKHFIGIDRDLSALEIARERLSSFKEKITLLHGNYCDIVAHLATVGVQKIDGFLFDLGVSSMQLDQAERGFSFSKEAPLDMRMNREDELTAAKIINTYTEKQLASILRDYGEERYWRAAAAEIIVARQKQKITTTQELAKVLMPIVCRGPRRKIHPLTLVFQGLRIAVNRELEGLEQLLPQAMHSLQPGGRMAIISFHSLEDRIVKQAFQQVGRPRVNKYSTKVVEEDLFQLITKKPIIATEKEQKINPRSRSAKLRCIEKTQVT